MKRVHLAKTALVFALTLLFSQATAAVENPINALYVQSPQLNAIFHLDKQPVWQPGAETHILKCQDVKYEIANTLDATFTLIHAVAGGIDDAGAGRASMNDAMENILAMEPINSLRNRINVYMVHVVSQSNTPRTVRCKL